MNGMCRETRCRCRRVYLRELVMKRTLNSVYATPLFPILASFEKTERPSLSRFSSSSYLSPSPCHCSTRPLVLITASQRVCHCLHSIGLKEISSRDRERVGYGQHCPIAGSGESRLRKNPAGKTTRSPPSSHLFSPCSQV